MKITDFSIIFAAIFLSFYLTYVIGDQVAYHSMYSATLLNHVMDEIVQEALEAGYQGVDENGEPILNKEQVIQSFLETCGMVLEGRSDIQYYPAFIKKIILIESDHYFVYDKGNWSQAIVFEDMRHEERVQWITKSLEKSLQVDNSLLQKKKVRYRIALPCNQGEYDSQTLQEYAMLVLCEDSVGQMQGECYGRYFLSGAALKEVLDYE